MREMYHMNKSVLQDVVSEAIEDSVNRYEIGIKHAQDSIDLIVDDVTDKVWEYLEKEENDE